MSDGKIFRKLWYDYLPPDPYLLPRTGSYQHLAPQNHSGRRLSKHMSNIIVIKDIIFNAFFDLVYVLSAKMVLVIHKVLIKR